MADSKFKNQWKTLLVSSVSLILFLMVVFFKESFSTVDANVNSWSASIQSAPLNLAAIIISYGFDTTSLLAVSFLIAAYLLYKHHKKDVLLLAVGMIGDAFLITAIKSLAHSARPLNGIISEQGFSFPSGHVVSAVVLFGLLAYFAWEHRKSKKMKIFSSLIFLMIAFAVGFDRIYLNVHWLSDVLGGYLLGIFWLTFSIFLFQVFKK